CDSYIGTSCNGVAVDCTRSVDLATSCCQNIRGTCFSDLHTKAQWCDVQATDAGVAAGSTGYVISGSWPGCKSLGADGGVEFTAYYANRYATVAQATGGIATSICDQDYTPALAKLGLQASGLRSDFPLSRTPISTS